MSAIFVTCEVSAIGQFSALLVHSNLDIVNKSVIPFLFTISIIKCNMLSKFSKWELGFVHYVAKFTILRFVISRFESVYYATYIIIISMYTIYNMHEDIMTM